MQVVWVINAAAVKLAQHTKQLAQQALLEQRQALLEQRQPLLAQQQQRLVQQVLQRQPLKQVLLKLQ